jgi:hypothetical protein
VLVNLSRSHGRRVFAANDEINDLVGSQQSTDLLRPKYRDRRQLLEGLLP